MWTSEPYQLRPGVVYRFTGNYLTRLNRAVFVAVLVWLAAVLTVYAATVVVYRQILLWPEAQLGTPQHWFAVVAYGAVLSSCFLTGYTGIQGRVPLHFKALNGWTEAEQRRFHVDAAAVAKQTMYSHVFFGVALISPLWPYLEQVWLINEPDDLPDAVRALALRLVPAVALWFTQRALAMTVESRAAALDREQMADRIQMVPQPVGQVR